jgi:hypothetical protein
MERPLVGFLFAQALLTIDLSLVQIEPLQDGGMGSMRIASPDSASNSGGPIAECHFKDSDDTPVSAVLYGIPFEVCLWKVNFKPLLRWPETSDIVAGPI